MTTLLQLLPLVGDGAMFGRIDDDFGPLAKVGSQSLEELQDLAVTFFSEVRCLPLAVFNLTHSLDPTILTTVFWVLILLKCGEFFNLRNFQARCETAILATALGIAWSGAAPHPVERHQEHHGLLAVAAFI